MKRDTEAERARHARNARRSGYERVRRKNRKLIAIKKDRRYRLRLIATERVVAPEVFELETLEARAAVVDFLAELRVHLLLAPRPRVMIDFTGTRRMSAAATLLFAAELSRIYALTDRRPTCNYPREDSVAQVLQHVGIFALLNQRRTCRITRKDVKYWKVSSGSGVLGRSIAKALRQYSKHFAEPERKLMYRALTEAQTNCRQHAYEEERGDGHPNIPNWWMFSQFLERRITVAFCDLGMGIPRSLPTRPDLWKRAKRLMFFRGWGDEDAHRIRAAMSIGASRTHESHRGKGLNDMRKALDGLGGRLQIHSNAGLYAYDAATKSETCQNFPQSASILGTIVLWTLPV